MMITFGDDIPADDATRLEEAGNRMQAHIERLLADVPGAVGVVVCLAIETPTGWCMAETVRTRADVSMPEVVSVAVNLMQHSLDRGMAHARAVPGPRLDS